MGTIGVAINGSLFVLWVILGSIYGFEPLVPAMMISGMFTIVSALTID